MPRNNKKTRRKFDTRKDFKYFARVIGLTPKQRLVLGRYMKKRGENL